MAKAIHSHYNTERIRENPNEVYNCLSWDELPQDLKNSNIDQAAHIETFLDYLGYGITDTKHIQNEILSLSDDEVEVLAIKEHARWVLERKNSGWTHGKEKDIESKTSPYMVKWKSLSLEIQNYDREAVRKFIPILNSVGLKVCTEVKPELFNIFESNAANAPIVISVSGHRDAVIESNTREEIEKLFITLRRQYPHTDLILMSGLADGADREVIKIALKNNVRAVGVIANDEEWFVNNSLKDDPKSYIDFLWVKSKCMNVYELPTIPSDDDPDIPYRAVNAYMVSNSHILIALWDGYAYKNDENGNDNPGTYGAIKGCFNGIESGLIRYTNASMDIDEDVSFESDKLRSVEDCLVCWIPVTREDEKNVSRKTDAAYRIEWDSCSPRYLVPHLLSDVAEKIDKKERGGLLGFGPVSKILDNFDSVKLKIKEVRTKNKTWVTRPYITDPDERTIMRMRNEMLFEIPDYFINLFLKIDEFNLEIGFSDSLRCVNEALCLHGAVENSLADISYSLLENLSKSNVDDKKMDYERECWNGRYYLHSTPGCPSKKSGIKKRWENWFYNKYKLSEHPETPEDLLRMDEYLNQKAKTDKSVEELLTNIRNKRYADEVAVRYHLANELAISQQKKSNRSISTVILLTLFFSLMFYLFVLTEVVFLFVLAYVVMFLIAWAVLNKHVRNKEFKKFLDYRYLAETLRVEYYWRLLGINRRSISTYYDYTRNQVMWVKAVLKGWSCRPLNNYSDLDEDFKHVVEAVRRSWVEDQRNYHWKKKKINTAAYMFNGAMFRMFSFATLLFSALGMIISYDFLNIDANDVIATIPSVKIGSIYLSQSHDLYYITIVKMGMIVSTVSAAYFKSRTEQIYGGTPEHIQAKLNIFVIADSRLRHLAHDDVFNRKLNQLKVLRILGDQSIRENSEWVFEHSSMDILTINAPRSNV